MKRTPLKRRTELKNRGELKAKAPMERKPMERRRKPKRQAANDNRWRSPAYLRWVRQQPCARCGSPADDAHHVIGLHWGLSGMGTTAPDSYAMPVCRACHLDVHRLPELQRCQPGWLRHTIARGVREFGGDIGQALREAWAFIDEKEVA
ncbi:HNH endonuclease signature motif containing protein [Halomonas sp. B23F22_10]|uniref:HNH endonuclease signature motif containing protein n=1 Tax=Halomonas sp. B23F22_10 TaxID=3459515 RepID=UPI00373E4B01